MKSKFDPRHLGRIEEMQSLFAYSFGQKDLVTPKTEKIIKKMDKVDEVITQNAPKWPIDKINRIDLAILRLAIWEIVFEKKNPPKVLIDEAIELGKEFGTEHSFAFINGVLGSVVTNFNISTIDEKKEEQPNEKA